jgi:hypothetical protein
VALVSACQWAAPPGTTFDGVSPPANFVSSQRGADKLQRALQHVELRQSFTPNIVVAAAAAVVVVVVVFFEFQFFLMSIYNTNLYLKGGGLTTPHALLP